MPVKLCKDVPIRADLGMWGGRERGWVCVCARAHEAVQVVVVAA